MPYLKTMTADLLDACVNISHLTEVNVVDHNGLTVSVERKCRKTLMLHHRRRLS